MLTMDKVRLLVDIHRRKLLSVTPLSEYVKFPHPDTFALILRKEEYESLEDIQEFINKYLDKLTIK